MNAMVKRFKDAFNRHDLEYVLQSMTDVIIFENTSSARFEGGGYTWRPMPHL